MFKRKKENPVIRSAREYSAYLNERAIGRVDMMQTYQEHADTLRDHCELLATAYVLTINGRAEEAAALVSEVRVMGKPFTELGEFEVDYLYKKAIIGSEPRPA